MKIPAGTFLRVDLDSQIAGQQAACIYTYASGRGGPTLGRATIASGVPGSPVAHWLPLPAGDLLAVEVAPINSGSPWGAVSATLSLTQGSTPVSARYASLATGWPFEGVPMVWRAGDNRFRLEEPLGMLSFTTAQPGAGVEVNISLANWEISELVAVAFTLVCSGAVATRRPKLQFWDWAVASCSAYASAGAVAGSTTRWEFLKVGSLGAFPAGSGGSILPAGLGGALQLITTATENLQAGDQYSEISTWIRGGWALPPGPA